MVDQMVASGMILSLISGILYYSRLQYLLSSHLPLPTLMRRFDHLTKSLRPGQYTDGTIVVLPLKVEQDPPVLW